MVAAGTYNVRPLPAQSGTAAGVIAYVGNPGNPSSVILANSPSDNGTGPTAARSFVSWDGFYCKEDWGFFGSQSPTGVLDSLRIARCILEEGGGIRRAYRSGYYDCVIGMYNKPDRSMYISDAGQNNYIKRCRMRLQIPNINAGNDILKFDWSVGSPIGDFIRGFVCDSNTIDVKITGTACVDTTNYETLTRGIKIRGVRQSFFRYNRITISDSTTGTCVGAPKVAFWMRDYADSNVFLCDTIIADGGNNSAFRFDITNDGNGGAGFPRYNTYSRCIVMNLSRCYATRHLEGLYWRGGMNYATIDSCSFVNGVNAGSMDIPTMQGTNRIVHNNFVATGGRPALTFGCNTCTGATTTFKNNIIYSQPSPAVGSAPLSLTNTAAMTLFDSDYNLYTNLARPTDALTSNGVTQGVGATGLPCTIFGRDCHSISFSPGLVDSTAISYNALLLPGAKPIGAGENQRTIGVKQYPPGHTLVITVAGSGAVTKNPDQVSYDPGTLVQLAATPSVGYTFSGWSGDAGGGTNPLTVLMDGSKSITATFAINTYTVAAGVVGSGTVTRSPNQAAYDYGTSVQLTANPAFGYHFAGWSGDTTGTSNPFTVTLHQNKSYTASFAINTYTVSAATVGNGTVTRSPDQATYDHGSSVQLTANPTLGYHFVGWSGDTTGTSNPFTVILHQNKSITATFAINTYTVATAVVGSGTVTRSPNQSTYDYGTSVQVSATPGTGYSFTGWSGDTTGTSNPFTVILRGDKSYTATFAINSYTLGITTAGSGTVTRSPDQATYAHGTLVQLTPNPGTGYSFASWGGDTSGTANPLTVVMTRNRSITANFTINSYTLSTAVAGSGSVSRNPSQTTYDFGTSVQVTATPGIGYHFTGWSGDTTSTSNPFTVIVRQNKSYTATFAIDTYTLSTAVVGSGSVTRNPSQATYDYGTSVQVTATPDIGYHFTGWSGDTTGTSNPFTVIVRQNKSYAATFAINTYTVSTAVVGSGSVTRNPSQANYNYGTSVQVTATPDIGYHFTGWSGDTTGTSNPFTVIVRQNRSYTASFAINAYTLSTAVVGSGSVTRNPSQTTYDYGTSVDVTATPGTGYSFTGWGGDTTGTSNPFTVILRQNKSYTATFTINSYTMSVTPIGSGTVTRNPNQAAYTHGTSVQLTPNPDTGYSFTSWGDDTSGTANPLTVVMTRNRSITATFAISTYSLAVTTVGLGTVARSPDQASYEHGTFVDLTPVAAAGYTFTGWSGDATGAASPLTVLMDGNQSITATFAINTYTVSAATVGHGTATRSPDQASYDHGSSVQLAAMPATGYSFTGWSGDTTGTMNSFTVILHTSRSYNASFVINTYALTIEIFGSGTVTKNPDQPSYDHGTSVELSPNPETGFSLASWGGDTSATASPLTLVMTRDRSITATFAISTYSLAVTTVGLGTVTRNPDQANYEHGAFVDLTPVAATGYTFSSWSGDATGAASPLTVLMEENQSITATFAINTYPLTIDTLGSGTVTKNPDQGFYDHGASVEVTAIPESGYSFTGWSGDTTGTMNPLTLVMDSGKQITATFGPLQDPPEVPAATNIGIVVIGAALAFAGCIVLVGRNPPKA